MRQNQYVQLATRSLVSLCELTANLEGFQPQPARGDFVAEALREGHQLWERLAWSDGILNDHECAVLDAIMQLANERGHLALSPDSFEEKTEERRLPEFLRVASLSQDHGPRLAGRMINQLETFGYGVLAADRQIHEAELANLKEYIAWLRKEVEAVRLASLLTVA